jgi:copper chaperone CopZ
MTTYQFHVLNIKCGGCVNTIQTELLKINGVSSVIVIKDEGSVIVSGIALERENLLTKLHEIGYPEEGHNDFMSKAKSFITCTIDKF